MIWTLDSLADTGASLTRLTQALQADLTRLGHGESAQGTIANLQLAARLNFQEVVVAVQDGEAVGIVSIRLDLTRSIGYVRLAYGVPGVDDMVHRLLVDHAFARVWSDPSIMALDAMLLIDQPGTRSAFAEHGIQPIARQEMHLDDLSAFRGERALRPVLSPGVRLAPWRLEQADDSQYTAHENAVADLILAAYEGTIDETLYPGLNNREGLRSFFNDVLHDPSEPFNAQASRVAYIGEADNVDSTDDVMAGQIFCGGTGDSLGNIMELTVRPEYRRRGLGRALMTNALAAFAAQGLPGVKLWVTLDNPARHLYESFGFRPYLSFWVYSAPRPT